MRKKGKKSFKPAGKSAIPPDKNNDFTVGVEKSNASERSWLTHQQCPSDAHSECMHLLGGTCRSSGFIVDIIRQLQPTENC